VSGDSEVSAVRNLAPEALVRVRVNDTIALEWSCTPDDLPTLAAGWLVCEGVVRTTDEIQDLSSVGPAPGYAACLEVRLQPAAWHRLSRALSSDAEPSLRPTALASPHDAERPSPLTAVAELRPILEDHDRVAAWFRDMFEGAALRSSVGGVHTGGLVVGGDLAVVVEDVSRHHVVDRLVGSALQAGAPLHRSILLVSARISGAMAAKACRAGVGALVSRSIPTELAASVAGSRGLILVGRARREQPHYYWPESGEAG
jgi:FdhD protein